VKSAIRLAISVLVMIAVVIVAYSLSESDRDIGCSEDVYLDAVGSILDEWEAAVELAHNAERTALASRISELQDIRLRASDKSVPACAVDAQALLIGHMEITIDAFRASLSEKGEEDVKGLFDDAAEAKQRWRRFVDDLGR
jgi:hypothetical protein